MNLKAKRPGIELAAEWTAACCLAAAAGFAVLRLTPLGLAGTVVVGLVLFAAARAGLGLVDRGHARSGMAFEAADFPTEADDPPENEVLLLDDPVEDVLLLDAPVAAAAESRVVRLFGDADQPAAPPAAIPAPGEMLARIEDFLGLDRGSAEADEPAIHANRASADASAALHAALADIRRSLRQG